MKILTTSTDSQTIRVIPRSYPEALTMKVRDDSTNEIVTYTFESSEWNYINDTWEALNTDWNALEGYFEEGGYLVIENVYTLVENRFYDLELIDGLGNVIYKDKIFCTNQPTDDFTINRDLSEWQDVENEWDEYAQVYDGTIYISEETYDNDYIII